MRLVSLSGLIILTLLNSGCDLFKEKQQEVNCSSPEAEESISKILVEETSKAVKSLGIQGSFNEVQVKASLDRMNISIEDIRTTSKDKSTTLVKCEAEVKIKAPASIWDRANASYETITDGESIENELLKHGLEKKGEWLTKTIEYSVQPTDDNTKVYTKIFDASSIADALSIIISSHLLKNDIDQQVANAEAEQLAIEQESAAQAQLRLDEALVDNKSAKSELNKLWSSLPTAVQNALTDNQSAWVKRRNSECSYNASTNTSDPMEQKVIQTLCETSSIRSRIDELKNVASSAASEMVNATQNELNTAKNRLNQTWASLPSEVKATLEAEQETWWDNTQRKCSNAANAKNSPAEKQLAQLQCAVNAYNQRIDTLDGYSIH